ncbi:hypothetical protein MIR68_007549 [Amoeboaphelidium protococcarum]|nr:hypothetical protein MIR68_007549 [Amoeboaphelidium protococcarum]KAI3642568.1 hypothetical protein MP228_012123 [Amoeboaphelidium protococcarum]
MVNIKDLFKLAPEIFTLNDAIRSWTLQFNDQKIERAYLYAINLKYHKYTKAFTYFVTAATLLNVLFYWMTESTFRFFLYSISLGLSLLPIVYCWFRVRQVHMIPHIHRTMAICLFLVSWIWTVGQPIVLLSLGDYLDLDCMSIIWMFFLFGINVIRLSDSLPLCAVIVASQFLCCVIGLLATRRYKEIFPYLVNYFMPLLLAFVFAFVGRYGREMFIRRVFLVRYLQNIELLWKKKFASSSSRFIVDQSSLNAEIAEINDNDDILDIITKDLPGIISHIPDALQSRYSRRSLDIVWRDFWKYKICMSFENNWLERQFEKYSNIFAINRIRLFITVSTAACISTMVLNIILGQSTVFEYIVRLGYIPLVATVSMIVIHLPAINTRPMLLQYIISIACFMIVVGNLLLIMQQHVDLQLVYQQLDPFGENPSLNTPSHSNGTLIEHNLRWLPPPLLKPFTYSEFDRYQVIDGFNVTSIAPNVYAVVNDNQIVIARYNQELLNKYIVGVSKYISQLNGFILLMSFLAPSTGMRFHSYLIVSSLLFITIFISCMNIWIFGQQVDGQTVRMLIITLFINISSLFVSRSTEREMRRFYQMKVMYKL